MAGRLFPQIQKIEDPMVQQVLLDMAEQIEMLVGTAAGLVALPPRPYDGQVDRFKSGVAGSATGLYEFRGSTSTWIKL